jgi:hypothetical protein
MAAADCHEFVSLSAGVRAVHVRGEVSAIAIAWELQLQLYSMLSIEWDGLFEQMKPLQYSMRRGWGLLVAVPALAAAVERAILRAAAIALKTGPGGPRSTVAVCLPRAGSENFTVIIGADEFWERSAEHRIDPAEVERLRGRAMSAPPPKLLQELLYCIYATVEELDARVHHPETRTAGWLRECATRTQITTMPTYHAAAQAVRPTSSYLARVQAVRTAITPPLGPGVLFKKGIERSRLVKRPAESVRGPPPPKDP